MKEIRLTKELEDDLVDLFAGTFLEENSYDILVTEDADVFKPSGQPLVKFRKAKISQEMCRSSVPVFREAAGVTDNRGMAAGRFSGKVDRSIAIGKEGRTRYRARKKDGTISATSSGAPVNSGIIGYFDRAPRFPFCRLTAFNLNKADQFTTVLPLIRTVDAVFKEEMPDRYEAQMAVVKSTNPDFFISGTAFTTVTVNKNFRTAVHKDAGDLKEGFGVMACLRTGSYDGCYLCFPKFRVAVDMGPGDITLADVHEWHGNTPLIGKEGCYERISLVFYYREGMKECGSATDELERAKVARGKV